MAANKFATMLHRNTNRIAVVLVYTVLEWTLIVLLLLNGLFSYLITKFAAFFGLHSPCIFCSRVDHLFEPEKGRRAARHLLCDGHAAEVSRLGYCSIHRRLAEAGDMCEDCSSSRPAGSDRAVPLLSWMKRSEEGAKDLRCSCCDVILESGFYSPYLVLKPSWGVLEYGNLAAEMADGREEPRAGAVSDLELVGEEKVAPRDCEGLDEDDMFGQGSMEGENVVYWVCEGLDEDGQEEAEEENMVSRDGSDMGHEMEVEMDEEQVCRDGEAVVLISEVWKASIPVEDASLEVVMLRSESTPDADRLFPLEMINSATAEDLFVSPMVGGEDDGEVDHGHDEQGSGELDAEVVSEERLFPLELIDLFTMMDCAVPLIQAGDDDRELGCDRVEVGARAADPGSILEDKAILASATEKADIVQGFSSVPALDEPMKDGSSDYQYVVPLAPLINLEDDEDDDDAEVKTSMAAEDCVGPLGKLPLGSLINLDDDDAEVKTSMAAEDCVGPDGRLPLTPLISFEEDEHGSEVKASMAAEDCVGPHGRLPLAPLISFGEDDDGAEVKASMAAGDCIGPHGKLTLAPLLSLDADNYDAEVKTSVAAEYFSGIQAPEEDDKLVDVETTCEISIGSEICEQEQINQAHLRDPVTLLADLEEQCSQSYNETTDKDQNIESQPEVTTIAQMVGCQSLSPEHDEVEEDTIVQRMDHLSSSPDHKEVERDTISRTRDRLSLSPEHNEVEEDRAPETPTSIDGIHGLHRRFLFGRREYGTESLDGSVASEVESSEALNIDQRKSALKAELRALYAELEEERSASAIAANQSMAMITRLQEEKAAMQMEASQYQRMLEEQSEFDQEALQLLNELVVKREKEKQELEKELEVYRKKVLIYEAKERTRVAGHRASGRSGMSPGSSSAEDSDDLSSECHEGEEYAYGFNDSNQNTPTDAALSSGTDQDTSKNLITLNESLADFEEERLAILEQLKALEEKLFALDDEDSDDDIKAKENSEENGHASNGHHEYLVDDGHGFETGFSDDLDTNGKLHHEQRSVGFKGKTLLPLFDAISTENEDELSHRQEAIDVSPESVSKFTEQRMNLAIVEEVNNVYERLQALEADREFLKHCIKSLKKGDKGMDLLNEILQHLRDLRSVELRVRNADDALASL